MTDHASVGRTGATDTTDADDASDASGTTAANETADATDGSDTTDEFDATDEFDSLDTTETSNLAETFHVAPFDGSDELLETATPVGDALRVPARRLLAALVATPSVSGEESQAAELLAAFFAAHGREVTRDAAGNVRAPADDGVLLTSHIDTVPGEVPVEIRSETDAPWGGAPTEGADDAVLAGRGSVDATGSLAAMAAVAVAEGVSFAGVVGEETDAVGARHLVAERDPPEAVINGEPSGWDAVTLAYRGLVQGTYRVTCPGTHGSVPTPNATQRATAWWSRIERLFAADGPVVERVTATPTTFDGGRDGTHSAAEIEATFRVPVGVEPATVRQAVEATTAHGSVSWGASVPPTASSPRVAPATALRGAIRAAGGEPRHLRKTGTADANHYAAAWDVPVVTYGPGDAGLDHAPDERLPLPAFDRAVAVLADAVARLR